MEDRLARKLAVWTFSTISGLTETRSLLITCFCQGLRSLREWPLGLRTSTYSNQNRRHNNIIAAKARPSIRRLLDIDHVKYNNYRYPKHVRICIRSKKLGPIEGRISSCIHPIISYISLYLTMPSNYTYLRVGQLLWR
jgi:hypothetical protein